MKAQQVLLVLLALTGAIQLGQLAPVSEGDLNNEVPEEVAAVEVASVGERGFKLGDFVRSWCRKCSTADLFNAIITAVHDVNGEKKYDLLYTDKSHYQNVNSTWLRRVLVPESGEFKLKERVSAIHKGYTGKLWDAVITKVYDEKTFDLQYDDGDTAEKQQWVVRHGWAGDDDWKKECSDAKNSFGCAGITFSANNAKNQEYFPDMGCNWCKLYEYSGDPNAPNHTSAEKCLFSPLAKNKVRLNDPARGTCDDYTNKPSQEQRTKYAKDACPRFDTESTCTAAEGLVNMFGVTPTCQWCAGEKNIIKCMASEVKCEDYQMPNKLTIGNLTDLPLANLETAISKALHDEMENAFNKERMAEGAFRKKGYLTYVWQEKLKSTFLEIQPFLCIANMSTSPAYKDWACPHQNKIAAKYGVAAAGLSCYGLNHKYFNHYNNNKCWASEQLGFFCADWDRPPAAGWCCLFDKTRGFPRWKEMNGSNVKDCFTGSNDVQLPQAALDDTKAEYYKRAKKREEERKAESEIDDGGDGLYGGIG